VTEWVKCRGDSQHQRVAESQSESTIRVPLKPAQHKNNLLVCLAGANVNVKTDSTVVANLKLGECSGVWGCPQRGPGAEPLVGGSAPWSWKFFLFLDASREGPFFTSSQFCKLCKPHERYCITVPPCPDSIWGTPFPQQNIWRNGVPPHSAFTTPLKTDESPRARLTELTGQIWQDFADPNTKPTSETAIYSIH